MKIKKFDKEKDNPDSILGIAQRDYWNGSLYVIDRKTGIKISIVEEDNKK